MRTATSHTPRHPEHLGLAMRDAYLAARAETFPTMTTRGLGRNQVKPWLCFAAAYSKLSTDPVTDVAELVKHWRSIRQHLARITGKDLNECKPWPAILAKYAPEIWNAQQRHRFETRKYLQIQRR